MAVRAETIEENLPGGAKPTRIGIDFTQPVARGRIRLSVSRAEPLLTAEAASLAAAVPARLGNLSTLNATQPGEGGLIAGFSLAGTGRKQVLLRAVGPGIGQFGVPSTLRDPMMVLRASTGAEVGRNDNWQTTLGSAFGRVGAFPLQPGSADAAVLAELPPGSYTAQIESADGATGNTLVELYDAGGDGSRLVNLSTRGTVSPGAPLTLGLSVGAGAPRWFLLRGIGPGLAPFGVSTALADPQLTVFRGEAVVAHNDDWSSSHWTSELAAAAASVQAFALPESSADAALVVQLPPGNYTFQVAAKGSTSGTVLGEAYELP